MNVGPTLFDPPAECPVAAEGPFHPVRPLHTERARTEGQGFALFQLDAVGWLRGLSDESVDLVITDPPYESLEVHRAVGTTTRLKHSKASSNDWFQIFPNRRFPELFTEIFRVLRKNAHFYLFCDQQTLFVAKPAAEAAGFRFWKPLVWDKQKIGMGYHYRARYEFILFFEKGKRRLNDLSIPDVIAHPRIRGGYPAEKPAELSQVLVVQSTLPGELVIDPFMGSGSVGVAAMNLGRVFRGNDINPIAVELAVARLSGVVHGANGAAAGGDSSQGTLPADGELADGELADGELVDGEPAGGP